MKNIYFAFLFLSLIPNRGDSQIRFNQVKTGLGTITDITHAGDGSQRIFVASKTGTITILDSSYNTLGTLLNLVGRVNTTSEMGLLGIAFHPSFVTNGYFFVNYNPSTTRTSRISRFTLPVPSSNMTAALATEKIILEITDAAANNHKAGDLAFGHDGMLYITTGDGGGSGDPQRSGQNGNTLLGKILRLDINTNNAYVIPPTNPFISNPTILDEIWDMGLRNPWRISFDKSTGDLWIADVGQNAREEINVEAPGAGGKNYGWFCREGTIGFSSGCSSNTGFTDPIFDYTRCGTPCVVGTGNSITGGFVYRGNHVVNTSMRGYYLFADYVSKHAWILKQVPGSGFRSALDVRTIANFTVNGITTFGELENGEILAGTDNGIVGWVTATRLLPIQLTEFDVLKKEHSITINWHTTYEKNIVEYTVEKSTDGINYYSIGSVSAGNKDSNQMYSIDDNKPMVGTNYYRLQWLETTGEIGYSPIKKITWSALARIYYHALTRRILIDQNKADTQHEVQIISINGQINTSGRFYGNSFALPDLAAGVYWIRIKTGTALWHHKFCVY